MKLPLLDMDKDEWRGLKRGDSWRSTVPYQCQICYCVTNLWRMGGVLGYGPRISCPGTKYKEHDLLEKYSKELESLYEEKDRRQASKIESPIYALYLEEKNKVLVRTIDNLIGRFHNDNFSCNDVVGIDPYMNMRKLETSSRYIAKENLP